MHSRETRACGGLEGWAQDTNPKRKREDMLQAHPGNAAVLHTVIEKLLEACVPRGVNKVAPHRDNKEQSRRTQPCQIQEHPPRRATLSMLAALPARPLR